MSYFKLFEAFTPKPGDNFKKRKLQVYDIKNPPEGWEKYCVVEMEDPEKKVPVFVVMEMIDTDFGKMPDFKSWHLSSPTLESATNSIALAKFRKKGLSTHGGDWMEEGTMEFDKWEEIVKDAAINDALTDNDYKILGVNKDDYKIATASKKFGLDK